MEPQSFRVGRRCGSLPLPKVPLDKYLHCLNTSQPVPWSWAAGNKDEGPLVPEQYFREETTPGGSLPSVRGALSEWVLRSKY